MRDGNIKVNSDMIDVLFQCLDALEGYVSIIQETSDEGDNDNQPIINALNACLTGKKADAAATPAEEKPAKKSAKKSTKSKAKADTKAAEEKKEEAPAPAVSMKLSEEEQKAVEDAMMANRKLYHITVTVQDTCLLKAARTFLVFKAIEDHGEVLATNPSTQDIEDEKFDFVFQILIATDGEVQPILDAIKTVSEISDAVGVPFSGESAVSSEEPAEEEEAPAKEADKETLPAEAPQEADSKPAPAAAQTPAAAPAKKPAGKPAVNRTVRVDIEKLDSLMNLVSELIIAKNSLVSSAKSLGNNSNQLNDHIEYLESVTTNLHESVMKVRMVPIESVVTKFPRMIRDLSKKLNKPIELYMTGEDTELDRTVVDEIGDPLMHLLRNSADHGIEDPEIRAQRGKPEVGSIYLDAYQDGNNVVIEVKDDGNGIDVEAVKRKAIERGVLTEEQAAVADDNDIIRLLFLPSFSTAKKVTDVSGRGVGLDVVKSKIESLSGEVDVKSKLGEGSTFSIRLPLTLAIIQALMVVVGDEKYAIALGGIQTIEDISPSDIKTVQGSEVINLRGNVIPLVRLDKVVGVESKRSPEDNMVVVIAKKGDKLAGFIVDELIGQQEIVIKSMGKYINKCKFISGATILGDGEIALIIDANALM